VVRVVLYHDEDNFRKRPRVAVTAMKVSGGTALLAVSVRSTVGLAAPPLRSELARQLIALGRPKRSAHCTIMVLVFAQRRPRKSATAREPS
jgi:hypothetical protein